VKPSSVLSINSSDGEVQEPSLPRRGARTFQVVSPDHWPAGALPKAPSRQKGLLRRQWRQAVMCRFAESPRILKIAWALQELSAKNGYAFATDRHLASETSVPLDKVERALKELQDAGCIIRVHVYQKAMSQRRIFLSGQIIRALADPYQSGSAIPATVADKDTRHRGPSDTRHRGGTEDTGDTRAYRYHAKHEHRSTVAQAAERDAARRDERARGVPLCLWFDDDT
jgi:hypothetical protein